MDYTVVLYILLFVISTSAVVSLVNRKRRWGRRLAGTKIPQGPFALPVVGAVLPILRHLDDVIGLMEELEEKFGLTAIIETPHLGTLMLVGEPESAEYILKTNFANYPKGPVTIDVLRDLLGEGIFATDGDQWKTQRKTFSHLFKVVNMKSLMYKTFVKHASEVLKHLQEYSETKSELNIQDLFYRFTLDSIGEIAFGQNIGSLEHETPFSKAYDVALKRIERRVTDMSWRWTPDFALKKAVKILDDYAYNLIAERRRDPHVKDKDDLLSSYINNTDENDKHLRDVIINFLIAGRDTTGQTLSWLFYLLSINPQVEQELLKEIDSLQGITPSYDELKRVPYLEGVIKETLRLYPPVPFDSKYALEDDVLPNGYFVPKGTTVIWTAWNMGKSSKLWKDPLKVDPTRWMNEKLDIHPFAFIPFQAGPRICLGQAMAIEEVKLCTIMILQKYRFKVVKDHPVVPVYNITLNTTAGIKMTVESR